MTFHSIDDPTQVRVHDDAVLDDQPSGPRVPLRPSSAPSFEISRRIAEDGTT
jgi:hypothetical protein